MQADRQGKWVGPRPSTSAAPWRPPSCGDANKVKYVSLDARSSASPALQAGEVDLLVATTRPYTLTRDAGLGVDFTGIYYYDGQGFLVNTKSAPKSVKDLNRANDLRSSRQPRPKPTSPTISAPRR